MMKMVSIDQSCYLFDDLITCSGWISIYVTDYPIHVLSHSRKKKDIVFRCNTISLRTLTTKTVNFLNLIHFPIYTHL